MIGLSRRRFFVGAAALFCAPAIVRASSLMPVRSLRPAESLWIEIQSLQQGRFDWVTVWSEFAREIERQIQKPASLRLT